MLAATPVHDATRPVEAIVYIVDDDPDLRKMVATLSQAAGLSAQAFGSAREFLASFDDQQFGCVVLDLNLPGMSGLQLQQQLTEHGSAIPIIFLSGVCEISAAAAAMRAGAIDFISKPFCVHHLLERIHEAIDVDRRRRQQMCRQRELQSRLAALTAREREVMELLARGTSTKAIARQLGISQKTVINHRTKVLEKMAAENSAQLAATFSHFDSLSISG